MIYKNCKLFKNKTYEIFYDTANLDQIREANDLGVLDGVTTNPSLMAKEGIKGVENCKKHYVDICNIVQGDVSAEVIATDYEGMIKEGEELAALHPNIVVKVPCIAEGIKAIKYFTGKGIRTNCTLVFSQGPLYWLQKPELPMYLLLWAVWTIFVVMVSSWLVRSWICTVIMVSILRFWLLRSGIRNTSFSV